MEKTFKFKFSTKKREDGRSRKLEINLCILGIALMLAICMLHALSAGHYVDFGALNGTFQNFNPVRRMLAGQIPYRDFQDYLGMGHLYVGSIATFLLGGRYKASLIAFSFLTLLGLGLIFLCIGTSICKKPEIAIMVTDLVLLVLLIRPAFYTNALSCGSEITLALDSAVSVGNSARFVRGMILPLSVMLFVLGDAFFLRISPKILALSEKKELYVLLGTGIISGFSFIWGNDYGISCWVCLAVMTFVVSFSRKRKIIRALVTVGVELFFSALGICVFVEVITRGNLGGWIKATFGTGRYQGWYYNGENIYYIFDVDLSYIILSQAVLCIVYLYKLFMSNGKKAALVRYGIPAYVNMVGFCAVNEYRLLSRGINREVALSILFATVLFEIINFMLCFSMMENVRELTSAVTLMLGITWCCSTVKEEVVFALTEKDGGGGIY